MTTTCNHNCLNGYVGPTADRRAIEMEFGWMQDWSSLRETQRNCLKELNQKGWRLNQAAGSLTYRTPVCFRIKTK